MKTFLIRGVPASIQRDSWWMDGNIPRPPSGSEQQTQGRVPLHRAALLAALLALADVFVWQVVPGLSLALFGLCLHISALAFANGRGWGGVILGVALSLPLVEHAQTLSVIFWGVGLVAGAAWIALGGWSGIRALAHATLRLLYVGPLQSLTGLRRTLPGTDPSRSVVGILQGLALGWTLPVIIGLVFLNLLLSANPLIENWLQGLGNITEVDPNRLVFWAGMALLIWPFLNLIGLRDGLIAPERGPLIGPRRLPAVLNPDAIRRSLVLFNLLFSAQTVTDAAFLWGGVTLPEGMSYAEYAHRGAYPLLATALLAGAFALVARPFTGNDRLMHLALLFWVGQTVLLVISSLLRLELYIEVYGLTRLRLAAGIWMVLVACSLALIIWQIIARRSAAWLLLRATMMGAFTLYLTMFLSFDRTIAAYNLTHPVLLDAHYICGLGPAALPAIARYDLARRAPLCRYTPPPSAPVMEDWREWGFRDWRVLRSLGEIHAQGAPL